MKKILLVEDDVAFCNMLETFLSKNGFSVQSVYNLKSAFNLIDTTLFDLIISDMRLPEGEGTEILKQVISKNLKTQVVLMTGYADVNTAVEAMKIGAFDYLSKPVTPDKLLETIKTALSKNTAVAAKPETVKTPAKKSYIEGISDAAIKLNDYIKLVAPTNMSVLITGDSGTGKEYIANSIHKLSKRANGPFVPVDCGAVPKEIASSEFFGHVKGSFTGAINDKTGHFEAASGGTLFLDEVGNLSYDLQVQLLRALQERKIKPVGSNKEIAVDIRIITATNENLELAVFEGNFREDLFHRLNEFSIKAPLLKDRKEDLILFADFFLEKSNLELEKNIIGFENDVIELFKKYPWPGNLREMQNTIKRAVLLCQSNLISLGDIPQKLIVQSDETESDPFALYSDKNEIELILNALEQANGNKSKAAKLLQIDRKTLYNKLKQYDIKL